MGKTSDNSEACVSKKKTTNDATKDESMVKRFSSRLIAWSSHLMASNFSNIAQVEKS